MLLSLTPLAASGYDFVNCHCVPGLSYTLCSAPSLFLPIHERTETWKTITAQKRKWRTVHEIIFKVFLKNEAQSPRQKSVLICCIECATIRQLAHATLHIVNCNYRCWFGDWIDSLLRRTYLRNSDPIPHNFLERKAYPLIQTIFRISNVALKNVALKNFKCRSSVPSVLVNHKLRERYTGLGQEGSTVRFHCGVPQWGTSASAGPCVRLSKCQNSSKAELKHCMSGV